MAQNLDFAASSLLCGENTNTFLYDLDCNAIKDEFGVSPSLDNQNNHQDSFFNNNESKSLMCLTIYSEETMKEMVEREVEYLPRDDYRKRLRSGDLDLNARKVALDWIWKAKDHYNFGPLSVCVAINYFDRFLSVYDLPKGKAWTVQLLAVACLSLAIKMEETKVPLIVDLQVGEPKFVFEAKTIQRMELLVLHTLKWRMQVFTPFSFIDYFLGKINQDKNLSTSSITKSVQLIPSTIKGIDFLEFRPSEIAAAVAISVSGDLESVDIDKAMPCFFIHVGKGRVLKCIELIKDLSLIGGCPNTRAANAVVASVSGSFVPQSPNGVLDAAACLSYKSDDLTTVGSCANFSSHNSPDIKRRKEEDNNNNNQPLSTTSSSSQVDHNDS